MIISKIENFNYQSIVNLNQSVSDKRYLILDLWEDIRNFSKSSQTRYNQIFLQINDLRVLNSSENTSNRVYFDLTNNNNVIGAFASLDNKIIDILKNYLASINKKGKFNFRSVVKDDRNDNGKGCVGLALNLVNQDYDISYYDINKKKTSKTIINKPGACFNIILELMNIILDMKKGEIVADIRLRMCRETRIKISNVDLFIQDSDDELDEAHEKEKSIKQSFDITQTDVFEADNLDQQQHYQRPITLSSDTLTSRLLHADKAVEQPIESVDKLSEQLDKENEIIKEIIPPYDEKKTQIYDNEIIDSESSDENFIIDGSDDTSDTEDAEDADNDSSDSTSEAIEANEADEDNEKQKDDDNESDDESDDEDIMNNLHEIEKNKKENIDDKVINLNDKENDKDNEDDEIRNIINKLMKTHKS